MPDTIQTYHRFREGMTISHFVMISRLRCDPLCGDCLQFLDDGRCSPASAVEEWIKEYLVAPNEREIGIVKPQQTVILMLPDILTGLLVQKKGKGAELSGRQKWFLFEVLVYCHLHCPHRIHILSLNAISN